MLTGHWRDKVIRPVHIAMGASLSAALFTNAFPALAPGARL
jgi:hypothetical protein